MTAEKRRPTELADDELDITEEDGKTPRKTGLGGVQDELFQDLVLLLGEKTVVTLVDHAHVVVGRGPRRPVASWLVLGFSLVRR